MAKCDLYFSGRSGLVVDSGVVVMEAYRWQLDQPNVGGVMWSASVVRLARPKGGRPSLFTRGQPDLIFGSPDGPSFEGPVGHGDGATVSAVNDSGTSARSGIGARSLRVSAVLAGFAVGGMWLPWFRSGQAGRNSFAAFRAAQILGVEWITPLRILWFLLPVLFVGALICIVARLSLVAAVLLVLLGVLLTAGAGAFLAFVGPETGSAAAIVFGSLAIALALIAVVNEMRIRV